MRTSSAKAKGRRLAQKTKEMMLAAAPQLLPDDIVVTSAGDTGEDLKLSPAARQAYPFSIECKNRETINIWQAYEQACGHGDYTPLLVFSRNRAEVMCTLKFEHLLELLNEQEAKGK